MPCSQAAGARAQVVRVIPYSAAQLCGYELFKKLYLNEAGELPMHRKLAAGASAGMLSTLVCACALALPGQPLPARAGCSAGATREQASMALPAERAGLTG